MAGSNPFLDPLFESGSPFWYAAPMNEDLSMIGLDTNPLWDPLPEGFDSGYYDWMLREGANSFLNAPRPTLPPYLNTYPGQMNDMIPSWMQRVNPPWWGPSWESISPRDFMQEPMWEHLYQNYNQYDMNWPEEVL